MVDRSGNGPACLRVWNQLCNQRAEITQQMCNELTKFEGREIVFLRKDSMSRPARAKVLRPCFGSTELWIKNLETGRKRRIHALDIVELTGD